MQGHGPLAGGASALIGTLNVQARTPHHVLGNATTMMFQEQIERCDRSTGVESFNLLGDGLWLSGQDPLATRSASRWTSRWTSHWTSRGTRRELDTKRTRNFENGVQARLRTRGQSLVKTLSAEPRVLGHLRHALGSRTVAERQQKKICVFGV
jgi:hypothetical protein